jgi:serine/threonine-protein kinase
VPRHTLGRYKILNSIGKGAVGTVYLGLDPRINRTTAIKTVRFADDMGTEELAVMKERFFREAESAGTLSHPRIVTIYDAGEDGKIAYIAMEYLDGISLRAFTKKDRLLSMLKVVGIGADIAEALDYAHGKGVVHRDVKPANMMLSRDGTIKLTDFGMARMVSSTETLKGSAKGTPFYMSPEQFAGGRIDGRSDIFSLGVTLFHLLTGELPFRGDTPAKLMNAVMNLPHPDPRIYIPQLPKPIVTVLGKALEKTPERRYTRANHMARHLRQIEDKMKSAQKAQSSN